jgi:hypothetical protein
VEGTEWQGPEADAPHCRYCGEKITDFRTGAVACDEENPRHWWHHGCAVKEQQQ